MTVAGVRDPVLAPERAPLPDARKREAVVPTDACKFGGGLSDGSTHKLSVCRALTPVVLSPEELDTTESLLSPLLPLSLPGPHGRPQPPRRTTVGELSLEVVSGALLSMLAMPAECFFVVRKFVHRNLASQALKFSSQPGLEAPSLRSPLSPVLLLCRCDLTLAPPECSWRIPPEAKGGGLPDSAAAATAAAGAGAATTAVPSPRQLTVLTQLVESLLRSTALLVDGAEVGGAKSSALVCGVQEELPDVLSDAGNDAFSAATTGGVEVL